MATELVCRVWHAVHVPIVPSSFGLPTLWQLAQPLVIADAPFERRRTDAAAAARSRADSARRTRPARASVPPRRRRPPTTPRRDGCADTPRRSARGRCGSCPPSASRTIVKPLCSLLLLIRRRLMAVETVHALLGVRAHFVFVDDRVLLPRMALGTLAGCADERRRRLLRFDARPRTIDQERGDNQSERHDDGDENRPEGHGGEHTPARSFSAQGRGFQRCFSLAWLAACARSLSGLGCRSVVALVELPHAPVAQLDRAPAF